MATTEERWVYEFGPYRLDTAAQVLCFRADGRPIPLTPRAYDTLRVLVEHAGELVDKRTLMASVWPRVVVEENNLDQAMSALRQALGERRGDYRYIVTVRGRGYRFAAPVVRRPAHTDVVDGSTCIEAGPAEDRRGPGGVMPLPLGLRRVSVGIAVVGAAAVALAGAVALSSLDEDATGDRVVAAVAPGVSRSGGDPGLRRYTTDADAYQLYVNGRFHHQRYREAELRRALEYFEQAVERDPGFAPAYIGIAEVYNILAVFGIEPPNAVFPRARRAVDEALRLAPDLGEAHASLGHIKAQYEQDWPGAEAAYRRAIAENPSFAPAHMWFGVMLAYSGRFAEGLEHLRQAQALEPSSPASSALVGMVLTYERRYDEAIAQLHKTLEMDADLPTAHTYLALAYVRRGDFDAALEHLARVSSPTPGVTGYVGQAYALSGRRAEAVAEVQRLEALSRERYVPAYDIAGIHAALGNDGLALEWLERAFDEREPLIGWLPWDAVFDGLRDDRRYHALVERLPVAR